MSNGNSPSQNPRDAQVVFGPLRINTLFLDAGGVLCNPAWKRVSAALAAEGVEVSAEALAAAEPLAKRDIDHATLIRATDDSKRGWLYFNKVLGYAGVSLCDATDTALAAMRDYHGSHNLWEDIPDDVKPALGEFRKLGLKLVVVSNANGRLRHLFDRVGLTPYFDVVLDSFEWGVEKPDPRLFHLALEQGHADPQTTAHVGDLFHIDVAGARAAGLREGVLLDCAGLYADADCRRVRTLAELVEAVELAR
jgi:HAD superfamily hydrolase (TIGR01549 family)